MLDTQQQRGLPAITDYAAVIHYGRYSSRKQRQGTSEERQIDRADRWAAMHGITFTDRLIDRGKSGYHGDHRKAGDFGTLLQQAKTGALATPALVVLVEGDRAGREDVDVQLESLVLGLLRSGVDLFVVDANLHLNLERWRTDLGAQIQLQAILHGANSYSRRLSARMKDAHERGRQRIARGEIARPGWTPTWVDLVDGQWVLNDYAETVRRVIELMHSYGYNAAAKILTSEGHKPPRGKKWTQGNVRALVQSEAIAGGRVTLRRDPSSVVWGYFPALMDRMEWQALLSRIAARDGSPSHGGNQLNITFIGQGLSSCACCGRPVGARVSSYRQRSTGQRIQQRYVRCRGRGDGACDAPALPLPAVQAHLLTRLSLASLAQLFPQQQGSELSTLQGQAAAIQQQIEQQQAVASNGQQQIAALLATAPDAVPVVARAVAEAQQQVEALAVELHQTRQRLQALESDAISQLGEDIANAAQQLLQKFAREEDTPEDRRQINQLLRRLDLRVMVDAHHQKIGLSIGSSEPQWQPLNSSTAGMALSLGISNATYITRNDREAVTVPINAAPADLIDELTDQAITQLQG